MRFAFAMAAAVAALSVSAPFAYAMPWEQHPALSFPNTPMAEAPGEGLTGDRRTVRYFQRLQEAGYACDAQDKPKRHIHIVCQNSVRNRFVYDGQFVGAGYLELDRIRVDGVPLSRAGIIRHQDDVYGDKPSRSESE